MRNLEVSILPTLRAYAGISMRLYTGELVEGLRGIPDVLARVWRPPFDSERSEGWFNNHWDRYVKYLRWCSRVSGGLFHIADHSNAQLLLSLPAARTVVTCHDLYPVAVFLGQVRFRGGERRRSMFPTTLRLSLLRKAAKIIAISRYTLGECKNYLGIETRRLDVGYHGVANLFRSNDGRSPLEPFRRRHKIRPESINLLHVGSNDPRKNLGTVFRVLAALRENHGKDVCLIKVGSKFGAGETQAIRTLGLEGAIRDLGTLSAEETAQTYRACDVLLYPSFHEGFCRPVAEAMASGTPVVASNRGAIPEVAQGTQLLFHPEDVEGMAKAIVQVAESYDLREEMAQRGKLAAQKFTWEAHGAAVAEAYRAVAGRWV